MHATRQAEQAAQTAANRAVIERLNADVINGGQLDLLDQLYAADLVHERRGLISTMTALRRPGADSPAPTDPRDRFRAGYRAIHGGFPDWHSKIESMVADDDTVVVRYRVTGTNTGAFLSRPATGRRVELSEVVWFTFAAGRVSRIWAVANEVDLWLQLGVVAAPTPPDAS